MQKQKVFCQWHHLKKIHFPVSGTRVWISCGADLVVSEDGSSIFTENLSYKTPRYPYDWSRRCWFRFRYRQPGPTRVGLLHSWTGVPSTHAPWELFRFRWRDVRRKIGLVQVRWCTERRTVGFDHELDRHQLLPEHSDVWNVREIRAPNGRRCIAQSVLRNTTQVTYHSHSSHKSYPAISQKPRGILSECYPFPSILVTL